jgi:hypothetical protein
VIRSYWTPVGAGAKPPREVNYVIATLFGGGEGVRFFDEQVSSRVERLPGFAGLDAVTRRIAEAAL